MPMGMPYPKGAMSAKGPVTMSKLMGVETKEHKAPMKSTSAVMKAETKEYGKRPSSVKSMVKGEMKEHRFAKKGKK